MIEFYEAAVDILNFECGDPQGDGTLDTDAKTLALAGGIHDDEYANDRDRDEFKRRCAERMMRHASAEALRVELARREAQPATA